MRIIKKQEYQDGSIIITCEKSLFFGLFKTTNRFVATEEYPKGYWNWATYPNRDIVGGRLSFQLDRWCKDFK
jgi:hypothetical protein